MSSAKSFPPAAVPPKSSSMPSPASRSHPNVVGSNGDPGVLSVNGGGVGILSNGVDGGGDDDVLSIGG